MEETPADGQIAIDVESGEECTVISVGGQITELEADALSQRIDQLFEGGCYKLVFDLSEVTFMSSTGLGQIMRAYRIAKENDGYIRVAGVQPLVADVFRVTKLDKLVGMYDTVEEACEG